VINRLRKLYWEWRFPIGTKVKIIGGSNDYHCLLNDSEAIVTGHDEEGIEVDGYSSDLGSTSQWVLPRDVKKFSR
jgi:hypothetical protein